MFIIIRNLLKNYVLIQTNLILKTKFLSDLGTCRALLLPICNFLIISLDFSIAYSSFHHLYTFSDYILFKIYIIL
jgi:hypothetical protein